MEIDNSAQQEQVMLVRVTDIEPDPGNMRNKGSEEDLADLRASIKSQGLIQPIILRMRKDGKYTIVAGERRWRSFVDLGYQRIPALVKDIDDLQAVSWQIIENTHRKNLSMYEMFEQYQRIKRLMPGKKPSDIADMLGIDKNNINRLNAVMRDDNRSLIMEGLLPDEGGLTIIDKFDILPLNLKRCLVNFKRQVKSTISAKDMDVFVSKVSRQAGSLILENYPDMNYLSLIEDMTLLSSRIKGICASMVKIPKSSCENGMWKESIDFLEANKELSQSDYLGKMMIALENRASDLKKKEDDVILATAIERGSFNKAILPEPDDNLQNDLWADVDAKDKGPIKFLSNQEDYEIDDEVPSILTEEIMPSGDALTHGDMERLNKIGSTAGDTQRTAPLTMLRSSDRNPVFAMGPEREEAASLDIAFDEETWEVAKAIGWRVRKDGKTYLIRVEEIAG